MSYAVDANLLVYAADEASAHHARARAFLETCVTSSETFCLTWSTVMAYLRITTHSGLFDHPLEPAIAQSNVQQLLELPQVRVLSEQPGFWQVYQRATEGLVVRGNLVIDAHIAALLLQHEVKTLYTHDADFRRFPFLDVRDPLSAEGR